MNQILKIFLLLLLLSSCAAPSVVKVWSDEKHVVDSKKQHKFIFFVQSNNQINSRIAQDQMVRMASNPSIQGYLYTKGERINAGNKEVYRTKMQADGYDYVIVMRLVDSVSTSTYVNGSAQPGSRSFYGDYSFQIDPYAYNPGYERENKIFSIETNVYFVESGDLVWSCQSKVYNPSSVEDAIKTNAKDVLKKMKRQGFMI